jgi:hypothetical protein
MVLRCSVSLLAAVLLLAGAAIAQAPDPLQDPDLDLRVSGNVLAMARLPDGGVVFGGNFSTVNGHPRPSIARLDAGGELDMDWNPGVNGTVSSLATDASGAIYVGGAFSFIGGIARARIARLVGADAAVVDPDWNPRADASVDAIALDGGGSVYIGGIFQTVGDLPRGRLARLPVAGNGSPDAQWTPAANGAVNALQWIDGALHAGGAFTQIGGLPRNGLVRIDAAGVIDPAWTPNVGGSVISMLHDNAGRLYVGGPFSAIGGEPLAHLARISTSGNGAVDPTWAPQPNGLVSALLLKDGQLYAGGLFTTIAGSPRRSLARLSIDGAAVADQGFAPVVDNSVRALATLGNGLVAAGGLFTRVDGTLQLAVTRLSDAGEPVGVSDAETSGRVDVVLPMPAGELIVGGNFHKVDGLARGHLLKLGADGRLDPDWAPWSNAPVVAMVRAPDGGVIIGGSFTSVDDQPRGYLAKLDGSGTGDVVSGWAPVASARVFAMAGNANALFVGGEFDRINGVPRLRLARLTFGGQLDPSWLPAADGDVHALHATSTTIHAGGDFTAINGEARLRLARLAAGGAGAVDPAWNPGADARVSTVVVDGQGRVYAGGAFTLIAGVPQPAIARLAVAAGMVDASWNPSVNDGVILPGQVVRSTALVGQQLYVGGRFGAIGGLARSNVARISVLDASADTAWSPLPNGDVFVVAVVGSGRLAVGGDFVTINGQPRRGLALFAGDDTIFADGFE